MESQVSGILPLVHLMVLSMWGGVVATEAVIEIAPFRRKDLQEAAIRLHYWIDLLVELPLVVAVVVTGTTLLVMTDDITRLHVIKVVFGGTAVAVNLFCIGMVLWRARRLEQGDESSLWRASRVVLACFAVGLAFAAVAATLGFRLGLERLS